MILLLNDSSLLLILARYYLNSFRFNENDIKKTLGNIELDYSALVAVDCIVPIHHRHTIGNMTLMYFDSTDYTIINQNGCA